MGGKTLAFLIEDVKTNQGFKFWPATPKIQAPSASLQSTISMEQYRVFLLLVHRAAEIMSANPTDFFGPETFYKEFDDLEQRKNKMIKKFGGGGNQLPVFITPATYKDDGVTVKWLPGLKTKAVLNKHTGKPEVRICSSSDVEHPQFEHPFIRKQKDKETNEEYTKMIRGFIDTLDKLPDPYTLIPKHTQYDLAALCLGVMNKSDEWGFSSRLGEVVVTKLPDGPRDGDSNYRKRSNTTLAKKYASSAATEGADVQPPISDASNAAPAAAAAESSAAAAQSSPAVATAGAVAGVGTKTSTAASEDANAANEGPNKKAKMENPVEFSDFASSSK